VALELYHNRLLRGKPGDEHSDWANAEKIVRSPIRTTLFASNRQLSKLKQPTQHAFKLLAWDTPKWFLVTFPQLELVKLLAVPLVLAAATSIITGQIQREANQNAVLKAYFDKLEELTFGQKLLAETPNEGAIVLARGRTVAALRELDHARKTQLIAFLAASDLSRIKEESAEPVISFNGQYLFGLDLHEINLSNVDFQSSNLGYANLKGANLSSANLEGASLEHANLTEAFLWETNLTEAFLWETNLKGAFLEYANLKGAFLGYANLKGAKLINADLKGAFLGYANLKGAKLINADLSDADLSNANLFGADLSDADLSNANLFGADLSLADLFGANLSDADLSDANLFGADLSDADLSDADLSDANLFGANLAFANLQEAVLQGANLTFANLTFANLQGANLQGANLSWAKNLQGANLQGAKWDDKTQWPDPAEVAKALNIPEELKQQLGITYTPPPPAPNP
jgi:uncharacterized protein YjbI with pentapeptide repeats